MHPPKALLLACVLAVAGTACHAGNLPPIKPVAHVDLPRFMGRWYVIACIPTRFEKHAYNAVETYTLQTDGTIDTRFHFRDGAFDKPLKTIRSTGFVTAGSSNAVWGVQVLWPLKAQYVVAWLNDDYSQTIVARDARDYTWIMARTPTIPQADYDALIARVQTLGYSMRDIRKVPQAWLESGN
ncbi:lipocalin family protein [Rhodanobacter umsongensis]|uniref:Outer membrane lipoprotein Blc n=1 Tax=Rhodanobacter umsongensis TaxID=633153 RepID=A0ABW0JI22_9GAMM